MITILGAGLAGISASYHLGHELCRVFEKNKYPGGHIHSYSKDGCTWDEGPHVSFTKSDYVRKLFTENTAGRLHEFSAQVSNYYKGHWIPHPAQSNLNCIPQSLRDQCWKDFINSRSATENDYQPGNYEEWLLAAFGKSFYEHFSKVYTEKYWTISPKMLTTDWVGERVFYPSVSDVEKGYKGIQDRNTHYITSFRYPDNGGYYSFAEAMTHEMNMETGKELSRILFSEKKLFFSDGSNVAYNQLISTIPLPELILKSDAPGEVKEAARALSCSSLLLVNVIANHVQERADHWMYVYDADKYSTRISFLEKLAQSNAGNGQSAIQVEVYFSKYKPFTADAPAIARIVTAELIEMGLVKDEASIFSVHTKWVEWANVIFDFRRKEALELIFSWLEQFGYKRKGDELAPITDWNKRNESEGGELILAGRFAEWKYYWTDDCVLTGKKIASAWL